MSKPLVTVITATTGSQLLKQNLASIKEQTYKNIQHLVVVDGIQHEKNVKRFTINQDILVLPYPTGIEQYNGHRIYGGCTYFAKGDFIRVLSTNYLSGVKCSDF